MTEKPYKVIYIVEDEQKIARLVEDYVKPLFEKVVTLHHGNDVLPSMEKECPNFLILDIMLPGKDGFDILKEVRQKYHVPILMLSAKTEEIDRLMGLEFGADDYMTKPFSPREMVARIKAIMRRVNPTDQKQQNEWEHNGLYVNNTSHVAMVNGKKIHLTPTEFSLLFLLMKEPGTVFERYAIMQKILGYEFEGYERTIDAHVKNIRKKIAQITPEEKIESIYGLGYKMIS